MKTKALTLLAILSLSLGFYSCSSDDDNTTSNGNKPIDKTNYSLDILGKWDYVNKNSHLYLEFYKGMYPNSGPCTFYLQGKRSGSYSMTRDSITIETNDNILNGTFSYRIAGDKLIFNPSVFSARVFTLVQ